MLRAAAAAVLAALVLAGCGGSAPAGLPGDLLPGMRVSERALGPEELAGDAVAVADAREALTQLGPVEGVEREFTGHTEEFDHVVARALRFESETAAAGYLAWLAEHAGDVLGEVKAGEPLPFGDDGLTFTLVPCGGCKKELPTYLAAWRRGREVASLLAAGRGANAGTVTELAGGLDATLTGP